MADPTTYREFSDPTQLASLLSGRDVLMVFDPKDALTGPQLDAIGTSWHSVLETFANAGGIIVVLNGATDGASGRIAGQGWRLVTVVNVADASPIPPPPNELSSINNERAYPASDLGTDDFFIAQGAPDTYATPAGSSCFDVRDSLPATVYEHVGMTGGVTVSWRPFVRRCSTRRCPDTRFPSR